MTKTKAALILILSLLFMCVVIADIANAQTLATYTIKKGYDTTGIENPGDWNEKDWSKWIAQQMGLDLIRDTEVRTYDGSWVDIHDTRGTGCSRIAYEVEWATKWKESIGQSLLYGIQSNSCPGVILLVKGKEDLRFIHRCQIVCVRAGIIMKVQRVPKLEVSKIDQPIDANAKYTLTKTTPR